MNAATQAATLAAMHRNQLLDRLKQAGAFSRDSAVAKTSLPPELQAQAKYYLGKGILSATPEGGLFVNKRALEEHNTRMKTIGKWSAMLVVLSTLIGILLLIANKN
jgi:hypothetical protein